MIVTIDGPAASGKSTVARRLAARLGFHFLNTGAMYRAVALRCVQSGTDPDDVASVAACARAATITFPDDHPHLDGRDVSLELRSEAVSHAASRVALNPGVREALVRLQRVAAAGRDVVTEGRDQGTIVFPDAEVKVFLTATAERRAARRHAELLSRGDCPAFNDLVAQIRDRDDRDVSRPIAPLRPAPDAVPFDTSDLTIDEAVDALEGLVRERQRAAAPVQA